MPELAANPLLNQPQSGDTATNSTSQSVAMPAGTAIEATKVAPYQPPPAAAVAAAPVTSSLDQQQAQQIAQSVSMQQPQTIQQQNMQFSWPASTATAMGKAPQPAPQPAANNNSTVQQQALQVNAGSQQAQQGFILPTVNQLPTPASVGVPNVFPTPEATNTVSAVSLPAPAPAAQPLVSALDATSNNHAMALPPPSNGDMCNINHAQVGTKRGAEELVDGAPELKLVKLEPSVVSSYSSEKAPYKMQAELTEAELEKMTPAEKRRYERNMREQQRSYRISQQIKLLRDVLEENKIPFKPNKFSILVSVVEYIKQLQARAIMLDSEHQRLAETIRQTNEMVSSGQVPSSGEESTNEESAVNKIPDIASADLMVKGLDYETLFDRCPSALGIASLDGRVLSCNSSFEELLSVQKDQVLQQSMFMYIRNHQDIFEAMADLLKRSSAATEAGDSPKGSQLLFWCGYVISLQSKKLAFSITLTNTADGDPKYFSLSAADMSKEGPS